MKEIKGTGATGWIVIITGLVVAVICLLFVTANLRATVIHRKTLFRSKPSLQMEKIQYYKDMLSYISQAGSLSPGNEDYYLKKAEILLEVANEGLQRQLHIYLPDIERNYIKR